MWSLAIVIYFMRKRGHKEKNLVHAATTSYGTMSGDYTQRRLSCQHAIHPLNSPQILCACLAEVGSSDPPRAVTAKCNEPAEPKKKGFPRLHLGALPNPATLNEGWEAEMLQKGPFLGLDADPNKHLKARRPLFLVLFGKLPSLTPWDVIQAPGSFPTPGRSCDAFR